MNLSSHYAEIARLEEQLATEKKWTFAQEQPALERLLSAGPPESSSAWGRSIPVASHLAAVRTMVAAWPEREKRIKARIFEIQSQIEKEKN